MLKLKITSTEIATRTVVRRRDQKSFTFREQSAAVSFPNGETRIVAVSLEEGQGAYSPGEYTLLPTSFYVDRNNKLALGRLHLAPVLVEAGSPARKVG